MDLTPILRPLAARRFNALERMDPAQAQERVLLSLVKRAQDTRFGLDHDFARVRTVADFQQRVPVRPFDDLWAAYWKERWPVLENVTWPGRVPFFARTSGTTTGRTKHIPITKELIRANEAAGFDLMTFHLACHPHSRPLAGKSFILGGSTSLEEVAPGSVVMSSPSERRRPSDQGYSSQQHCKLNKDYYEHMASVYHTIHTGE